MRTDLVEAALRQAVTLRGELPGQVIFHADRGTQYTSEQIATACADLPVLRSMGRTGVCWGQRRGGVVLVHAEDRVLQPPRLADEGRGPPRGRGLDRRPLQPAAAPFLDRHDQSGTVRRAPNPGGTSRLTTCPPDGVSLSQVQRPGCVLRLRPTAPVSGDRLLSVTGRRPPTLPSSPLAGVRKEFFSSYDMNVDESETVKGVPVSEEQIAAWAAEADAGYDPQELKRRGRGRPGRGAEPSQVVAVRFTAAELADLDARAALERKISIRGHPRGLGELGGVSVHNSALKHGVQERDATQAATWSLWIPAQASGLWNPVT